MTLDEAGEIFGYWQQHPPVYQLVAVIARILGWKGAQAVPAAGPALAAIEAEAARLGVAVTRGAAAAAEILDLDAMREKNRRRKIEIARRNAAVASGRGSAG